MIARIWKGKVDLERSDEYLDLMVSVALSDYTATPGNRGAFCLRRHLDDHAEFLMLTLWESTDSIRAFSGDDISIAKYYDFDPDLLLEMRPDADHYELYEA